MSNSTGQGSVPAPPHRTQLLQQPQLSDDVKNYLKSIGLSQEFYTNIVKSLPLLAVTLPWTQWFQSLGNNVNASSDLALLGAVPDETARGALVNDAIFQAVLALLQGSERPEAQGDDLFAVSTNDNARTDFRAFAVVDTHANKIKYPPKSVQIGQSFYETDRHYFYESDGTDWNFAGGCYVDTFANRPADLTAKDVGALFYSSDTNALYEWNGASWSGAIVNAETGFRQNNAAAANHVLASDGTNFVDRALVNADLPDSGATAHTITLLKLTGGGANGSITWNAKGVVTAFVDPT